MKVFEGFNTRSDFENQYVTQLNRLPAHSAWGAYENEADAREGRKGRYTLSLNGVWDFRLVSGPANVEDEFWDHEGFAPIRVPGCWELQGFSAPVYTNSVLPFADRPGREWMEIGKSRLFAGDSRLNPPFIPEDTRVGLYRRSFRLPEDFAGRRTILHFDGVENAYYLYVNGCKVGYSQDSKLPSDFDITDYVQPGENRIALAVFRFSDGFYLEDQDYFHLSGIFRDVTLYSKPEIYISDIRADAEPLEGGSGVFSARVTVRRAPGFADRHVRLRLYAPDGTPVYEQERYVDVLSPIHGKQMGGFVTRRPENTTASFRFNVENPLLWDTDHPVLYRMTFTLLGPDGEEEDFEAANTGCRRIGIENGVICLNGKRVVFRGVDRHEHAYRTGHYVPYERMEEEIRLMKQLNFNAVRTCHYPDSPCWYDLCDRYGIMVVCEADVETHAVQGNITTDPEWAETMLERARRMVMTHKNHPSIVSWSLGNESGCGANHAGMAGWIRGYDETRLVQYEGNDRDEIYSDIRCTMYAPYEMIKDMAASVTDRRPIVLIEYTYQIANTGGRMDRFNRLTEQYPLFQGGFVWDWQDKLVPAHTPDGREFPGYGGDFGEDFKDPTVPPFMCANGVVTCDLKPKPSALEIKQAQTPVDVSLYNAGRGVILVKNRLQSVDFDALKIRYTLSVKGKKVFEGEAVRLTETDQMTLEAQARGQDEWNVIPWPALLKQGDALYICNLSAVKNENAEVYLDVSVLSTEKTLWSEPGFEYTCRQLELKGAETYMPVFPEGSACLAQTQERITLSAGDVTAEFDRKNGCLLSVRKGGSLMLCGGGEPALTRASTGMQLGEKWGSAIQPSGLAMFDLQTESTRCEVSEGKVPELRFIRSMSGRFGPVRVCTAWRLHPDGRLEINGETRTAADYLWLNRCGVELTLPEGFETLEWYGRGPGESYRDRCLSAPVGLYRCRVEDTHFPFVPVSHCGSHFETRRVSLKKGGLTVTAEGDLFSFTAHHNTEADYLAAKHDHELIRRPEVTLALCGAESGIGGDMAWSTECSPADMVKAGVCRYGFVLRFDKEDE